MKIHTNIRIDINLFNEIKREKMNNPDFNLTGLIETMLWSYFGKREPQKVVDIKDYEDETLEMQTEVVARFEYLKKIKQELLAEELKKENIESAERLNKPLFNRNPEGSKKFRELREKHPEEWKKYLAGEDSIFNAEI